MAVKIPENIIQAGKAFMEKADTQDIKIFRKAAKTLVSQELKWNPSHHDSIDYASYQRVSALIENDDLSKTKNNQQSK